MITHEEALQRLIPLPHEISIAGWQEIERNGVRLRLPPTDSDASSALDTAAGLLREAGLDDSTGEQQFTILCALCDDLPAEVGGVADHLQQRLPTLPNHKQAYAIVPLRPDAERPGLLLTACTEVGILYAVRTLLQLLSLSEASLEKISMPEVTIVDWPDIEERGQWGGNTHDELEWTARWKMNCIEESAGVTADPGGGSRMSMTREYVEHAHALGTAIVPCIPHLEQIARLADLVTRANIVSTPNPDAPLPSEYVPGLCMSSPATVELVAEWMKLIAGLPHIPAIEVWLSEDRSPCYCPRCSGKEPFELEVACIRKSFDRAKKNRPEIGLRLLLTQGSYTVNDQVIAAAGPDVQISYYDGGRTYDSSHSPMIYPLLEEYARDGGWLGVYPQITHCWRTVFPFTAPQLIRERAQEFANKGLRNVIGYAVPSNRHHEFNVMALAEWSWNSSGRTAEQFARAYAHAGGICDPELYAAWALEAGEAGWWFAESRLLLRAIYAPDLDMEPDDTDTADHRFRRSGIIFNRPAIEGAQRTAAKARELARQSGVADLIDESEALHAGLTALRCIGALLTAGLDTDSVQQALNVFDRASAVLSLRVSSWGERVNRGMHGTAPYTNPMRMRDTANALLRMGDQLRRKPRIREQPDPHHRYRTVKIGSWSSSDFGPEDEARFCFDVTGLLDPGTQSCFVGFTYLQGDYAAEVTRVALVESADPGTSHELAETVDSRASVGRWEMWHDFKLEVPRARAGARRMVEVTLRLARLASHPVEQWECSGEIGLRLGWPGLSQPGTPALGDLE